MGDRRLLRPKTAMDPIAVRQAVSGPLRLSASTAGWLGDFTSQRLRPIETPTRPVRRGYAQGRQ